MYLQKTQQTFSRPFVEGVKTINQALADLEISSTLDNIQLELADFVKKVDPELVRLAGLFVAFNDELDNLITGSLTNTFNQLGTAIGNGISYWR